ncbi:MAG TPA: hypothetical protein VGR97_06055 [Candidatus Acidoferrales bacterium]|nr:hypothetical protein [Candidatus Acidoferrales bacterium]
MDQTQQATVIWPVIALAARMQRVLTYSDLEGLTGIPRYGQNEALHLVYLHCSRKGYPLLNSIVVNQATGFPGDEHPRQMTPAEFLIERARVFAFDWTSTAVAKPRPEDFQQARAAAI